MSGWTGALWVLTPEEFMLLERLREEAQVRAAAAAAGAEGEERDLPREGIE